MGDQDYQNCLAKLVGAQVEEGEVHSRMEGTEFAATGVVSDFEQAEEAVTQAIDMGIPLGCTYRK